MHGIAELDGLTEQSCVDELRSCCAEDGWARAVTAARPFGTVHTLRAVAAREMATMDWSRIRTALDAHPRIGERARGADTDARWSRQEQSAAATDDRTAQDELVRANLDYEQRFGHVFLICATGLSHEHILRACRERLGNDERTEREVVRAELARIVDLRIGKLVSA